MGMKAPDDYELHGAAETVCYVVQRQSTLRYRPYANWTDEDNYRCYDGRILGGPWPTLQEAKKRVNNMRRSLRRAYAATPTWRVVKRTIATEEVWRAEEPGQQPK